MLIQISLDWIDFIIHNFIFKPFLCPVTWWSLYPGKCPHEGRWSEVFKDIANYWSSLFDLPHIVEGLTWSQHSIFSWGRFINKIFVADFRGSVVEVQKRSQLGARKISMGASWPTRPSQNGGQLGPQTNYFLRPKLAPTFFFRVLAAKARLQIDFLRPHVGSIRAFL